MYTRAATGVLIAVALGLSAPARGAAQVTAPYGGDTPPQMRPIQLWTEDGVRLVGDLYVPAAASGAAVILYHSLGQNRRALQALAQRLARARVHVANMDLRGHGQSRYRRDVFANESITGGMDDSRFAVGLDESNYPYANFDRADWRRLPEDVQQVLEFVRQQPRVKGGRVALVGSSIGANAVLVVGARTSVRAIVALSPGESYRGIAIADAAESLRGRAVFVVAAEDDASAYAGAGLLAAKDQDFITRFVRGAAHGERLLRSVPGLEDEIVTWLLDQLEVALPRNHPEVTRQ